MQVVRDSNLSSSWFNLSDILKAVRGETVYRFEHLRVNILRVSFEQSDFPDPESNAIQAFISKPSGYLSNLTCLSNSCKVRPASKHGTGGIRTPDLIAHRAQQSA